MYFMIRWFVTLVFSRLVVQQRHDFATVTLRNWRSDKERCFQPHFWLTLFPFIHWYKTIYFLLLVTFPLFFKVKLAKMLEIFIAEFEVISHTTISLISIIEWLSQPRCKFVHANVNDYRCMITWNTQEIFSNMNA